MLDGPIDPANGFYKPAVEESEQPIGQQLLEEDFQQVASLGVRDFPTIVMVNNDNKGVKIVGGRPFEYYVKGLKQVVDKENMKSKPQPALSHLLNTEKLLFSKEIEEMYDIQQEDIPAFVEKELSQDSYQMESILGENYFKLVD